MSEIKELYKDYVIIKALKRCKYNISRTSRFLNLNRQTIKICANKYGINNLAMKKELKKNRKATEEQI